MLLQGKLGIPFNWSSGEGADLGVLGAFPCSITCVTLDKSLSLSGHQFPSVQCLFEACPGPQGCCEDKYTKDCGTHRYPRNGAQKSTRERNKWVEADNLLGGQAPPHHSLSIRRGGDHDCQVA